MTPSTRSMMSSTVPSGRISYVCPDHDEPSGGIRVIYRHVDRLNALGHQAQVVHSTPGFRCSWFANDTVIAYGDQLALDPAHDVLVLPEIYGPDLARIAAGVPRVVFNQGAYLTFQGYSLDPRDLRTPYLDRTLLGVMVVSEDSRAYVEHAFPSADVHRVHNAIDTQLFRPANKRPVLAFMPRRQGSDIVQVLSILKFRGVLDGIELRAVDGLSPAGVAAVLAESTFFLSTPIQEGCPVPPMEAMASGCAVIGYHGFGGREYLRPDVAVPVPYGDVVAFAQAVEETVLRWRRSPDEIAGLGRRARQVIVDEYSPEREDADLVRTWSALLRRRDCATGRLNPHLRSA